MKHTLTPSQAVIVKQYVDAHELDPSQISFDGTDTNPIFDHNAISVLSLRLTDIQDISPMHREDDGTTVTVFGKTVLPDGRERGWMGSCSIGETLAGGQKVTSDTVADGVATSRGFRQGIRNVGVNLHAAHQRFMATGEVATSHTNKDPRAAVYAEIHILATELDLIIDGDKSKYREYLAESYNGRTSAKDLDDIELGRLLIQFRSLARLSRTRAAA